MPLRTTGGTQRTVVYCIVPSDLAPRLHDLLREHFREDESVEVVVEMRGRERRRGDRRRDNGDNGENGEAGPAEERRRIRSVLGRRIADRRAAGVERELPELPRRARRHAKRLRFVERVEPPTQRAQDDENARLVTRFQSGDELAFTELYLRNFDSVYGYARMALKDRHEAEDIAQQVFLKAMGALPRYELRPGTPFRAWLFRIARNELMSHLRSQGRLEIEDPEAVGRRREPLKQGPVRPALDWISDADLLMFIERLPQPQRQAITLRYMLDLTTDEMCVVLERSPAAVRKLEHRALRFLEERLAAGRRPPVRSARAPMLVRMRRNPVLGARRFAIGGSRTGAPRSRRTVV